MCLYVEHFMAQKKLGTADHIVSLLDHLVRWMSHNKKKKPQQQLINLQLF